MKQVYLSYSETVSGGDIKPGQEDDSFPEHEDRDIEFNPISLHIKKGDSQETIDVFFDPKDFINKSLYLVVVRYYDGDTFGRINGYWYIASCCNNLKSAKKVKKSIDYGLYEEDYIPWRGYFAGLEGVDIIELTLKDSICPGNDKIFCAQAARLNDDDSITYSVKEKALKELFKTKNIDLIFYGKRNSF